MSPADAPTPDPTTPAAPTAGRGVYARQDEDGGPAMTDRDRKIAAQEAGRLIELGNEGRLKVRLEAIARPPGDDAIRLTFLDRPSLPIDMEAYEARGIARALARMARTLDGPEEAASGGWADAPSVPAPSDAYRGECRFPRTAEETPT